MKNYCKQVCRIAILCVALLQVVTIFVPFQVLPLLAFCTACLFVCGFPLQSRGFQKITLLFFVLGGILLFTNHMPLHDWLETFVSMTNVIAIIAVMQLFTLPIEIGNYSSTVEFWLRKSFKKESSLFLFAMAVTHAFSSFLLFGTVPVMVSLFSKALKQNIDNYQRFLATAIVRGYGMVLFWAPGAVIILLILQVTQVSWFDLFLPGFFLSAMGLATSYWLEHVTRLNRPIRFSLASSGDAQTARHAYQQSFHIILVIFGLLAGVSLFEVLGAGIGSGSGKILLTGLLIAGIWLAAYCRHPRAKQAFQQYWENGITKTSDLGVFFIATGLFAGAVDKTGILIYVQPLLQQGMDQLGMFSLMAVPLLFIALAVLGIHPFVLTLILGKVLMTLSLPLTPLAISLILILSSAVSFIVSPFAGMILTTSKFLNVRPVDIALKWNALYCSLLLAEGLAFIWILSFFPIS